MLSTRRCLRFRRSAFSKPQDTTRQLDLGPASFQCLCSVSRKALVESAQERGRNIVYSDLTVLKQFWVQCRHVLADHVTQFGSPLDASRPASYYSKVKQNPLQLLRCSRQCRNFEALKKDMISLPYSEGIKVSRMFNSQANNRFLIFRASLISLRKYACSRTPGMSNVWL